MRVIGPDGGNLGVLKHSEAMKIAKEAGLDLIEIAANAKPPVAKITDYGKFQYELKKKKKEAKSKAKTTETKVLQVKIGTGEHDLDRKARRASEWITEGHRVKIDLFLVGRAKYSDDSFKRERLERILKLITEPYRVADTPKRSPKGYTIIIERDTSKPKKQHEDKQVILETDKSDKDGKTSDKEVRTKPLQRESSPSKSVKEKKHPGVADDKQGTGKVSS